MPDFQLIANTESRGVGYLHGKIILSEELFASLWPFQLTITRQPLPRSIKLEDSFDILRKATPIPSAAEQMPVRKPRR